MNPAATDNPLQALLHRGLQQQPIATGAGDWLDSLRERGASALSAAPLPGRKDEAWRYTSLSFLEQTEYQPAREDFEALMPEDIEDLLVAHDTHRLVFVNGRLAPGLCDIGQLPEGVAISNIAGELAPLSAGLREQLGAINDQRNVFPALNAALVTDGALIKISAGVQLQRPIELLHVSVGLEQALICHPRHLLVLRQEAQAQFIERYCSLGDSDHFTNAAVELLLEPSSDLLHARCQEESARTRHLSDLQVRQQAQSRYRLVQPALGGTWSRSDVRVTFEGEQAEAELNGLMLARDGQLNDVHLDVRHQVPACTSRERFKGVLDGKGRVVFDGRILVARDAQKTDAQLSNDNLMLSRSAEVDTKPQLEIFADDVKCSHGTTVGEIDTDMLFYLQSRGIPQPRAIQMLCQGFAQEVLDQLPGEALREHVSRQLARRLAENMQRPEGTV